MSTTPNTAVPSPLCSDLARRPPASRCALICAASCGASASAGPGRASRFGATATTHGPKRWRGARPAAVPRRTGGRTERRPGPSKNPAPQPCHLEIEYLYRRLMVPGSHGG
jgi:hypothetical protein